MGGWPFPSPSHQGVMEGSATPHANPPRLDAGTAVRPLTEQSIHWPEELHPLARLDGPALIAAHSALQQLLSRYAKIYPGDCDYSAKVMEVIVSEAEGLYFVRIDQHVDKCGWAAPGFVAEPDWWELYAVTPDGRVLARNPYPS